MNNLHYIVLTALFVSTLPLPSVSQTLKAYNVNKAKAIGNSLKYPINKISHRPCTSKGKHGVCMFVWECMKESGSHIGMCTEGFMFGSCCSKDTQKVISSQIPSDASSSASSNSPTIAKPFHGISNLVPPYPPKPNKPNPSILRPMTQPSHNTDVRPGFSAPTILNLNKPSTAVTKLTTTTTTQKTTSLQTVTLKPPSPPTRPTRPPRPTKPSGLPIAPWWTFSSTVETPTTETMSTTTPKPTTTVTTTTVTPTNGPYATNRHSKHICGTRKMYPQPEGRIVNGTNSRYGEFPWQVSVRRTSFFGFSSTHRCGGALLNSKWIATAGHCVHDLVTSQIRIRVGEYDFSSVQEPFAYVERKAVKKVVHPKYNFYTYENDLALVEMETEVEFQPHIQPICLPGNDDLLVGEMAKVTGWGRLSEHGTLPSILQQASVPIMSNEQCKKMFLKSGRKEHIPNIFLCAGYQKGGRDSCQGDSGGPLQAKGRDGRWFLAGIISWGIGCAEPNLPGVCTRISQFVPWILEHVT